MKTSAKGIALIQQFEGLELKAYRCPANVLTIGYGHTGPDVIPDECITKERAIEILKADLVKFERGVAEAITQPLTQPRFDALVALAFNIGIAALKGSTLAKLANAGKWAEAGEQFLRWDKAGGKVLAGLTRRRKAERALFLGAN